MMLHSPDSRRRVSRYELCSMNRLWVLALVFASLIRCAQSAEYPVAKHNWQAAFFRANPHKDRIPVKRGPPLDDDEKIPLVVTNKCESTIWPGIATQAGTGPGLGGFELESGKSRRLWVGPDWQGRVWGRTNCTVNGESCACKTGDCFAKLDCEFSGATPATLAEFNLAGGVDHMQTFYDISLVDGYNIPMGINYIPAKNTTYIPPNLTNCACVATTGWVYTKSDNGTFYSNSSYPIPLESQETNESISSWCPWLNLAFPPKHPSNGIYPYPDDNVQRPAFAPCNSACAATGTDKDCCIGKYHDPSICKPSQYSKAVKAVCPDAYSFAFDDQQSTFIIPKGGGWEVVMCPVGRSTDILRKLGPEMFHLASGGRLSALALKRLRNATYMRAEIAAASGVRPWMTVLTATALVCGVWMMVVL